MKSDSTRMKNIDGRNIIKSLKIKSIKWLPLILISAVSLFTGYLPCLVDAYNQRLMWESNFDCSKKTDVESHAINDIRNNTIKALICKSTGDVLVQVVGPDGKSLGFKWVNFKSVIEEKKIGSELITDILSFVTSVSNAFAAENRLLVKNAQTILCQKKDGKYLVRRIKIGGICWDEKVDTYTGKVINRKKVPCRCDD